MNGRWAISHLYRLAASRAAAAAAWNARHPHRAADAGGGVIEEGGGRVVPAEAVSAAPAMPTSKKAAKIGLRRPPPDHPPWEPGVPAVSALGGAGARHVPKTLLWALLLAALTVLLRPVIMAACRRSLV